MPLLGMYSRFRIALWGLLRSPRASALPVFGTYESVSLYGNLGSVGVKTSGEHGLLGIALDPAFKADERLYLYYGTNQGAYEFRLPRFVLDGDAMDMSSEKISKSLLDMAGSRLFVSPDLPADLKVIEMAGRVVLSERVSGRKEFDLAPAARGRAGLYPVTLTSGSSVLSRKVLLGSPGFCFPGLRNRWFDPRPDP